MNRVRIRTFLFFVSVFVAVYSQAQVTGHVVDSTGQAIPFCNVLLVKASDSSLVTGATTDASGNFSVEKKSSGNFCLLITYTGYQKYYSSSFSLSDDQPKYDAGKISLHSNAGMLGEVQVVADKPFMEQKLDRTVFNIQNSVVAAGNNALDVLKKLPGVTVDNDGNIQVRGKPGVLIMIDGRTSYMSAQDVSSYLKNMNASRIDRIEVITNPSAKYDASGNAIINIVLKRDKDLGFSIELSASYGQGFYMETGEGIDANYHSKKWNLFGSYNYNFSNFYNAATTTTIFSNNSVPDATIQSDLRIKFQGLWNGGRAGADFMPNDKQTIGFVTDQGVGSRIKPRTFHSRVYEPNYNIDSSLFTNIQESDKMAMRDYDLNYKYDIDTTGKQLTADFNFAPFTYNANRLSTTNYYDGSEQFSRASTYQRSVLPTQINILAGQIDYTQPLGKKAKLETGVKSSYVSSDNDAQYWNTIQGTDVVDTTLTNHFSYTENIYSGYLNWIQKVNNKLDVQLGFRGEETQAKGTQVVHDVSFTRNYFNLFPSTFINWKVDSMHTLNISYSRRIDRPDYTELNPFHFYNDPYNYSSGNPYLLPQLSDNFELTHIYKQFFSTSLGYLHMTNVMTQIAHQDNTTHITYNQKENLSTYNSVNILFAATLHITKWLTSISSINTFYDHYYGPVSGGNYSGTYLTCIVNSENIISLKNDWSAEVSFFYRSVNMDGLQIQDPISSLDAGIKKKFANGKATIALNCSDIFWTSYQNQQMIYQNVNTQIKGHNDSRRVRLSISWRFGRSQYERDEKRKSAEEELKRAGNK